MDAASQAAYEAAICENGPAILASAKKFAATESVAASCVSRDVSAGIRLVDMDGRPRKQADVLVDIGRQHILFHDPGGEGFACVLRDSHIEVHALDARVYREVLAGAYFDLAGKGCNRNALTDAVTTLCAEARFKGECRHVWMRVAADASDIILDLCTDDWRVIRVTKSGWRIEQGTAVMFRRAGKPQALPVPTKGDFGRLWKYLNVRSGDRVLIAAFMLMVLNPNGPYPALILSGEQGSAKSTFAKIAKRLTDPSESALRSPPKEVRDLLVGALNSWLLCIDNLSWLPHSLSDALCRLSTGGAISERTLYSNLDETLVEVKRPVILNGIEELATRPDLAERGIHIELQAIQHRRTEADLWQSFEMDAPAIFAGLLDAVALALRDVGDVKIDKLPRMADFALWAEAGLPAIGFKRGEFMEAYNRNLDEGLNLGLESSAVGRALQAFIERHTEWTGNATDLVSNLAGHTDEAALKTPGWPHSARALHAHLNRLGPALRAAGIRIERSRDSKSRLITLCKRPENVSQQSRPSRVTLSEDANDTSSDVLHDAIAGMENEALEL